jgi:two-component system cell cycle sensor histidine kinase/response regulator CckA
MGAPQESGLLRDRSLYAFLATAPIACHEISVTGEIVFVNEAECQLLGLTQCQVLGRPIWDFIAPEELTLSREAVCRKMAGEQQLERFERDYIRPDGVRLVLEIHEKHIRDEKSHIVGMRSFLIDVTQRKRTEQALKESEKLYRHLVEHASDIICRTDVHGRFRMLNSKTPKLLGYDAEDLTGRSYLDLIRSDFRATVRRFYRQQLTRKLAHTYLEFPALTGNGREMWFGQSVELIEEDGRIIGFQAVARDITHRRRSEEMLKDAREDLERRVRERTAELECANQLLRREMAERQREEKARRELEAQIQHTQRLESLGVLAGGIAHDFNNLLAVIMGYASLALPEIPESSRARSSLEKVISAVRDAAQLTQQMLAYSGRGKFTIVPINVNQLIDDVTRLVATLISKKADLQLNLTPGLPAIEGDSAQLHQVFINLLTNASDALGECPGMIRVSTGTQNVDEGELASVLPDRRLPAGKYVFIEVADTGCGMDETTAARIFDPFFTTKFTGRGLGLAAVQGIVRGHHGTLQVRSEPGQGTTFRVLFPAVERPIANAIMPEEVPETEWRPEGLVLVVDDEPAIRALACQILEATGATVMTAVDGWDAVRQFEAHSGEIRAVLLDLTMPGLDGGEVFQRLTRTKPDVKVILCSGYDVQDVNSRLGPYKPTGFLRKPYSPSELVRSFRAIGL